VESFYGAVGDHSNPILKPQAAEIVRKHGETELSGVVLRTPRSQCWPGGVPYIFAFEQGTKTSMKSTAQTKGYPAGGQTGFLSRLTLKVGGPSFGQIQE
jgi:hypothetical protein